MLKPLLHPSLVLDRPPAATAEALLAMVAERAAPHVGGIDGPALAEILLRRERELPTGTPDGIAFPHAIDARLTHTRLAVVRADPPVAFGTTAPPCRFAFVLFGSDRQPWRHVRLLARLARIVTDSSTRVALDVASDAKALRRSLLDADRRLP